MTAALSSVAPAANTPPVAPVPSRRGSPAPLRDPVAPAVLVLADGTVFRGISVGAPGRTTGEVVFNTAMTGYQEILTDPSYARQIVTLTCPHIGNTGVTPEDDESLRIHAAGLVVKDLPARMSNWRARGSLGEALRAAGTVAIAGLDTRRLTRRLRSLGAQNGCILTRSPGEVLTDDDIAVALSEARAAPSMAGLDLAQVVTTAQRYGWTAPEWRWGTGGELTAPAQPWHVVAFDDGVKHNILRMLASRGCRLTVLPARATAADALALAPDGVFLSNGPGDPEPCDYAIAATRELVATGMPVFGICLGHQIMALAAGARTFKMKFGHHGANHPVKDLRTGRVAITSQNHGFAVDPQSLPSHLRVTHVSLFDGSIQGLEHVDRPAFCFQGHPEASPGPHDIAPLFDRFVASMQAARGSCA